jgi:hypothetical protein
MDNPVCFGKPLVGGQDRYCDVAQWGGEEVHAREKICPRYVERAWKDTPRLGARPTLEKLAEQADETWRKAAARSGQQELEIEAQKEGIFNFMLSAADRSIGDLSSDVFDIFEIARNQLHYAILWQKYVYDCPRPYQVDKRVNEMFCPAHPSFPAAHAAEAKLLQLALRELKLIDAAREAAVAAMVTRIADNRIVAGVHFPVDVQAGYWLADLAFGEMKAKGLFDAAAAA